MEEARSAAPGGIAVVECAREQWDALFSQLPAPHFPQAWCYGEGKRARGWDVERLVLQQGSQPVALCQVLVRRVLGIPVAARVNRGPMFLPAGTAAQVRSEVMRALRRRWRFGRRGLLLIAPALPQGESGAALMRAAGYLRRSEFSWNSALIDLAAPLDAIRARLSSKWRNHLSGAQRSGARQCARTDREAFDWMLERHAHNMERKGFVGPDVGFVRAVIDSSPQDFRVFQASLDEEPCCGILVARYGAHAETYLSWTSDAGRRANAHHLLLWQVIADMKAAGCRALDLGGYSTTDKYGAYKRGMKGEEYRLSGEWLAI